VVAELAEPWRGFCKSRRHLKSSFSSINLSCRYYKLTGVYKSLFLYIVL
jgi:hypothetical protein